MHCKTVVECGVRKVVSSYAFAAGLPEDGKLIMIDPERSKQVDEFLAIEPRASFVHESDLKCPLVETDMLFIDTWHVYGQLKRELAYWHAHARKYIVMHDTTVDGEYGEAVRWKVEQDKLLEESSKTGIPVEEMTIGIWPAVVEFLASHPEWVLAARYYNNHGLTVLMRVGSTPDTE